MHTQPRTSLDVPPYGQVAVLDATSQDYPTWDEGDAWVAYRAESLINPDEPPHPGFAVRTAAAESGLGSVRVELWEARDPEGLRLVHSGQMAVGRAGIELGNDLNSTLVRVEEGRYAVSIFVDAARPEAVSRVAFALHRQG